LRLIDDEDDGAAFGVLLKEKLVEGLQGSKDGRVFIGIPNSLLMLWKLGRERQVEDQGRLVTIRVELAEEERRPSSFPIPPLPSGQ
jgi:hypothetical protein